MNSLILGNISATENGLSFSLSGSCFFTFSGKRSVLIWIHSVQKWSCPSWTSVVKSQNSWNKEKEERSALLSKVDDYNVLCSGPKNGISSDYTSAGNLFKFCRLTSTASLFPINLGLKPFLYLYCRAPGYRYTSSFMLKNFTNFCQNFGFWLF